MAAFSSSFALGALDLGAAWRVRFNLRASCTRWTKPPHHCFCPFLQYHAHSLLTRRGVNKARFTNVRPVPSTRAGTCPLLTGWSPGLCVLSR
jgi:hypothetical protein